MREQLIDKLHGYMMQHHPELLIALQDDNRLDHYLETKVGSVKDLYEGLQLEKRPDYVIEALCLEELTRDLRPSRFEYMRALLEEEFGDDYKRMIYSRILTHEIINLIGACEPVFEVFGFSDDLDEGRQLKYAIAAMVTEYLGR